MDPSERLQTITRGRLGRYEVVGHLATGGMAQILLARLRGPSGYERPVVIKRILADYREDPTFVRMFLDEARIASRIAHPNVVHVHELGRDGEELFLVMEYVEGESAASVMRRLAVRRRALPPWLAAHIVAEACSGLHAAHEMRDPNGTPQEVVHRDISPQNLLLSYMGVVKVADFGIAKAVDRLSETTAEGLKGKLGYMSPEQLQNAVLDRRSDIYSLGIVLYELSTGHRFRDNQRSDRGVAPSDLGAIVPPSMLVPGYPARLELACMKALSPGPDDRFATAADFRRELDAVVRDRDVADLPDERLSALMEELFANRRLSKSAMVQTVQSGRDVAEMPPTEIDLDVNLPEATASRAPGRARSRSKLVVAALLAVSAAAAVGLALAAGAGEAEGAPTGDVAVHPPAAAPAKGAELEKARAQPAILPGPVGRTASTASDAGAEPPAPASPRRRKARRARRPRPPESPMALTARELGFHRFGASDAGR